MVSVKSLNPAITQKDLAAAIGKSERTIKIHTVALQEKGFIRRANGKQNGHWKVLVELSQLRKGPGDFSLPSEYTEKKS
ncbi:MAG: winged helix-turn-helix transcriptional regulator [Oscillospiraceae bacterium]|nr:winged helix-turn-helix transcriptional regulator [Oscillospiraceae bacterium]